MIRNHTPGTRAATTVAGRPNGTPERRNYTYQGTGEDTLTPGISPELATSKEARAAIPAPVPTLKGAVKVARFPDKCKYPFPRIAEDGGVWQLDPAAFKVTPNAIVQAARKWAENHGLTVKVVTDDGMAYVQFTGQEGGAR